jgi:hypothetical protein
MYSYVFFYCECDVLIRRIIVFVVLCLGYMVWGELIIVCGKFGVCFVC